MVVFMDTSALIKRYILEEGTETVDSYFLSANDIVISPITSVELHSALRRRLLDGDMGLDVHKKAVYAYLQEEASFIELRWDHHFKETAIHLISRNRIRALDAIQLTAALSFDLDEFVSADRRLLETAQKELKCPCTAV
jgi:uncharacterized protein